MPDPHVTYYVRIADNGFGQDKYEFSGSGLPGWDNNPTITLQWRNDCSGDTAGKVYKFDQSDPSNAYYRLGFSHTDDPYDAYTPYDKLGEASGVFYYGTPGQAGASTKVHVGIMFSGQPTGYANNAAFIHAFADDETAHDYGDNYFDFQDVSGQGCTSGNYGPPTSSSSSSSAASSSSSSSATSSSSSSSATSSSSSSSSCDVYSAFSGQLNTLIDETNSQLDLTYGAGNHTTLSYSVVTGYNTGVFEAGRVVATGDSLSNALAGLTPLISHFEASGQLIDELTPTTVNIVTTNNTTSYSNVFSGYNGAVYYQGVSGRLGKRFYVQYLPEVSGHYTGANVSFDCPETSLQVNLNTNKLIYDTSGLISTPEQSIHQFVANLNSNCVGYETQLTASCLKFFNGEEKLGNVQFTKDNLNAWSGDLKEGSYILRYESGSFETSLGKHTLGSGTLNVDRYV